MDEQLKAVYDKEFYMKHRRPMTSYEQLNRDAELWSYWWVGQMTVWFVIPFGTPAFMWIPALILATSLGGMFDLENEPVVNFLFGLFWISGTLAVWSGAYRLFKNG